jgi:hypothetical protein
MLIYRTLKCPDQELSFLIKLHQLLLPGKGGLKSYCSGFYISGCVKPVT